MYSYGTMDQDKQIIVRCRGIIVHDGKLLVVWHDGNMNYAALPGGHLEWGEDIKSCLQREIVEELGIEPVLGRLLYINNFTEENQQSIEFFFEIKNGEEFMKWNEKNRSHAHELAEVRWISPTDEVKIRPKKLEEDFRNGEVLKDETRYVS